MISDTLTDAIEEIRRYQKEHPEVYGESKKHIDTVVIQMEQLREYFDTAPRPEDKTISNSGNDD